MQCRILLNKKPKNDKFLAPVSQMMSRWGHIYLLDHPGFKRLLHASDKTQIYLNIDTFMNIL